MTMVDNEYAGTIRVADGKNPRSAYQHQVEAWKKLTRVFAPPSRRAASGLLVLPTGGGKTFTAAVWSMEYILNEGHKVLWIAHRHKLLDQARDAFSQNACREYLLHRDSFRFRILSGVHDRPVNLRADDDLVIASKDSLRSGVAYMLSRWLVDNPRVFFVIDEAHHATAKTYRKLIEAMQEYSQRAGHPFQMLGLTATPFRTDENEQGFLGKLFTNDIVYKIDLRTLISQRILADPVDESVATSISLGRELSDKDIKAIQAFDKIPERIARRIAESKERNRLIVQHYINNRARYLKTLVFAIDIENAITLNALFQKEGVKSKYVVSSIRDADTLVNISPEENQRITDEFRKGQLDVLINVEILTEGYDLPNVQTVFLTRPTTSTILMTQMIGRALRGPKAGGTEKAYIVSFIDDWYGKVNWVNPQSIIIENSGDFPPEGSVRRVEQLTRLVSIEKIEEFARMMDETVDTSELEKIPFIHRIPVGVYHFTLLQPGESGEEIERICDVLIYDNVRDAYQQFVEGLEKTFTLYELKGQEYLSDDQLDTLLIYTEMTYFDDVESFFGYREGDVLDILRFYAAHEEPPVFLELQDREQFDIAKLAQHLYEQPFSGKEEAEYRNQAWDDPQAHWKMLFGNDKRYFIRQLSIERERIEHPEVYEDQRPNIQAEQVPIERLSLHELLKQRPEQYRTIRAEILAKHTDQNGYYVCAISGYMSKDARQFQIDHIIPMSKGGLTTLDNLQLLTRWENLKKGAN
ncbi:DEAD/DEAH box helicase family protein [bacterium]|nr:DEAD/DEAH box helicase family protein [bacterium]